LAVYFPGRELMMNHAIPTQPMAVPQQSRALQHPSSWLCQGVHKLGRREVAGWGLVLLMACPLAVCLGCGTSTYEKRLNERSTRLEKKKTLEDKYKDLAAAIDLPGLPVAIAMVKTFGVPKPLCLNGKTVDGKEVDPKRAQPWKFQLPVPTNLTYEGMLDAQDGAKISAYCYFGAKQSPAGSVAAIASQMKKDMAALGQTSEVSSFTVETIKGENAEWKKIRCECQQEFLYVEKGGAEKIAPMDGVFEVYLHEEGGYLIVFAGRLPKVIEAVIGGPEGFAKMGALVAGGIYVRK
jgi:hypothetical protein